jgi:hypothetical protein
VKWAACAAAVAALAGVGTLAATAATRATPVRIDKGITANPTHNGKWIFPALRAAHAGFLVLPLEWAQIAHSKPTNATNPNDPAYNWSSVDATFQQALKYRIEIVPIVYKTPGWANGGQGTNVPPNNAADYGNFTKALITKYPQIKRFMVWGEPSRSVQWLPQGVAGGKAYADIVDAAYGAVHNTDPKKNVLVIAGDTFNGGADDANSTSAGTWAKDMVMTNGKRPRFDLWGMNSYTFRPINMAFPQQSPLNYDFDDLDTLASKLDTYFPGRNLKFFLSETGVPTEHGNPSLLIVFTRAQQADQVKQMWKVGEQFGRVAAIANYLLFDDSDPVNGWTTGLITSNGLKKPAWYVYRRVH